MSSNKISIFLIAFLLIKRFYKNDSDYSMHEDKQEKNDRNNSEEFEENN